MSALSELLELLHEAHRGVRGMFVEVLDWSLAQPGNTLVVQTHPAAKSRVRWADGGPYPRPSESLRRVWVEMPDRARVDLLHRGQVVRSAVRDGTAWWRWDDSQGETAGDLQRGNLLPPMLDIPLLRPATLPAVWYLQSIGAGTRAGREVVCARACRRENPSATGYTEFEFDREHGTPLLIATFEKGSCASRTEALTIDYDTALAPTTFQFDNAAPTPASGSVRSAHPTYADIYARASSPPENAIRLSGASVWVTGPPGAGKTTIAHALEQLLRQLGVACCVLDEHDLRNGLNSDLGSAPSDQAEQTRRVTHVAVAIAGAGTIAIVVITHRAKSAQVKSVRTTHRDSGVHCLTVWVDGPHTLSHPGSATARNPAIRGAADRIHRQDESSVTTDPPPNNAWLHTDLRVSGPPAHPRLAAAQILELLLDGTPARRRTRVIDGIQLGDALVGETAMAPRGVAD